MDYMMNKTTEEKIEILNKIIGKKTNYMMNKTTEEKIEILNKIIGKKMEFSEKKRKAECYSLDNIYVKRVEMEVYPSEKFVNFDDYIDNTKYYTDANGDECLDYKKL
jgi:predicted RNA-binding protein